MQDDPRDPRDPFPEPAGEPSPPESEPEARQEPEAEPPPREVEAWPTRDLDGEPADESAPPPEEAEAFDAPPAPDRGPAGEGTPREAHAVPATDVGESTQCPRCGTENRPGIAFCRSCGQRLSAGMAATVERPQAPEGTQACPRCGTHNRAGVGFCQNCGANLRSAAPPAEAGEPARGPAAAAAEAPRRRSAVLGPVVLLIGGVGIVTGWLLPFVYGVGSLWDRSFGTADGYGAAFWEGYAETGPAIVDQAYFSLAAAAPLLVGLLVLLVIGGFVRAAPGPLQLIGLIVALVWGVGLAALFQIVEVLSGWTGDLTALLRDLSPAGIIFFLAGLIVVIGSLTRFARS
jgi:hypothetical protein